MYIADVLRAAKAKIPTPDAWVKGNTALNASDWNVSATSEHARRFCAYGAILATDVGASKAGRVLDYLSGAIHCNAITYNDLPETTLEDVHRMYDLAIVNADRDQAYV